MEKNAGFSKLFIVWTVRRISIHFSRFWGEKRVGDDGWKENERHVRQQTFSRSVYLLEATRAVGHKEWS